MEDHGKQPLKKLKKESARFIVAGCCAVGTDLAVYYILFPVLSYQPAKAISFLSGTVTAYVINKYWTFEKKQKSYPEMIRFLMLYFMTLLTNVGVNKSFLAASPRSVFLAFLTATAISASLNFIGQKWWVFK